MTMSCTMSLPRSFFDQPWSSTGTRQTREDSAHLSVAGSGTGSAVLSEWMSSWPRSAVETKLPVQTGYRWPLMRDELTRIVDCSSWLSESLWTGRTSLRIALIFSARAMTLVAICFNRSRV